MSDDQYADSTREQLIHYLKLRDRQASQSTQAWVRAAHKAMDGDDRELRNRVGLAEMGPVTITNGDTEHHLPAGPAHPSRMKG
jgi:hypothetical protein